MRIQPSTAVADGRTFIWYRPTVATTDQDAQLVEGAAAHMENSDAAEAKRPALRFAVGTRVKCNVFLCSRQP